MAVCDWLRELAATAIRFSGVPVLIRNTYARRKVTMILYHDPRPEHFAQHMAYLSKRYRFLSLDQLATAIRAGDWTQIPPKSLVVTFDDGHAGNFQLLPIFRHYGVRPTIFLVTRVIGTQRHFWFRHQGICSADFKHLTHDERSAALERQFGFTTSKDFPAEPRHALSFEEIAQMKEQVDFEPHTCFHPVLTTCSTEQSRDEIAQSKADLEQLLGRTCPHFSYPNGDYGEREERWVREAGFQTARTIDVGWNDVNSNPWRLRITGVTDDASVNVLAAQLTGLTMYLRYFLKGGRGGRHPTVQAG